MDNIIKLIKSKDFIVTQWSGGKTTEIYIYPEDANYKKINFKYRISSATVELQESNFTKLNGVYRFISPLDNKLKLTHNHKDFINLNPFEIYEFNGSLDTTSYGIAKDFNLMLANGAKGNLISVYIEEEYIFNEESLTNQHTIMVFDRDVYIEVNNVTYILKPLEALITNPGSRSNLSYKVRPTNPCHMLLSKVFV